MATQHTCLSPILSLPWWLGCLHPSKPEAGHAPMVQKGGNRLASGYKIAQNATKYALIGATNQERRAKCSSPNCNATIEHTNEQTTAQCVPYTTHVQNCWAVKVPFFPPIGGVSAARAHCALLLWRVYPKWVGLSPIPKCPLGKTNPWVQGGILALRGHCALLLD